ncbi:MAG: hypothetical protein JRI25_19650 [Deltaproteobacteria bacterium]|nr:hypothetical protein [Deltaproteobacteria bacterium]
MTARCSKTGVLYVLGLLAVLAVGCMNDEDDTDDTGTDEGPCAAVAGQYTLESVTCNDVAADLIGVTVTYDFDEECPGSWVFEDSSCASTLTAVLSVDGSDLTMQVTEKACDPACDAGECTPTTDLDVTLTRAFVRDEATLTLSGTITQDIRDNHLSPCQVGEVQVDVLAED